MNAEEKKKKLRRINEIARNKKKNNDGVDGGSRKMREKQRWEVSFKMRKASCGGSVKRGKCFAKPSNSFII